MRVSGFFALSTARTCSRLRPSGRRSIRRARDRIGAKGAGEVRRLAHDTGVGIELQLNLNLVAGLDTCGSTVGVAQAV
jgi:hypothetical protein